MSLASKLKFESLGSLTTFAFYGIAGLILLIMLPLSGFPPHIAILGIVSLITAYGLFANRKWATWIVVILFFVITTFTIDTLYYVMGIDLLATVSMIAYLALTWVFTAYAIKNRPLTEA